MPSARTVSLKSLGCRTNQQEMAVLQTRLERQGFSVSDNTTGTDLIVVNTCCVTRSAESKSRRLIQALIRKHPRSKVMVTGCLVQERPDLFEDDKNIRWVVGNNNKNEIPSLLDTSGARMRHTGFTDNPMVDIETQPSDPASSHLTRFPVKIQEGCDFKCSYCIVPRVRGPSRSAATASIIQTCAVAVGAGYKELVLSGTHIGQFTDGDPNRLEWLLEQILCIEGDFRVRLSSLDPRDLTPTLLHAIASQPRICRHLHVSIQSLAPGVLQSMHRPHTDFDRLCGMLRNLRSSYPDLALGADLIVGFPGETTAQFEQTLCMSEQIGFTYAHIFPFSPRPGTPAAGMEQTIAESEKRERCAVLTMLLDRLNSEFIISQKGSIQRIIIEQDTPASGVTSNFLHVNMPGFRAKRNEWVSVQIKGLDNGKKNRCIAAPSER